MASFNISDNQNKLHYYSELKFKSMAIEKKDKQELRPESQEILNTISAVLDNAASNLTSISSNEDMVGLKQKLIADIAPIIAEHKLHFGKFDVLKMGLTLGIYGLYMLYQKNQDNIFIKNIVNNFDGAFCLKEEDVKILADSAVNFFKDNFHLSDKEGKKEVYEYYKSVLSGENSLINDLIEKNYVPLIEVDDKALKYLKKWHLTDPLFFSEVSRDERVKFIRDEMEEMHKSGGSDEEKFTLFKNLIHEFYEVKTINNAKKAMVELVELFTVVEQAYLWDMEEELLTFVSDFKNKLSEDTAQITSL